MMKFISKFALLFVIVTIVYLIISRNFFSLSPFIVVTQVLAVALSVWARRSFQADQFSIQAEPKEGQLLLKGPYHFIRHPMYTAVLLLIWSGILGHFSAINLVIGVIITGVVAIRITTEEAYLRTHYPDYPEYARMTKRIIPLII